MKAPRLIAQNLNSSDPAVAAAISAGDGGWLRGVVRRMEAAGLDAVDLNAGVFGAQESDLLGWMVQEVDPMTSLTLSIDSASADVLVAVAALARRPVILNSLPLDVRWSDQLDQLLVSGECEVVLSLRRGQRLPTGVDDRLAWAEEGVARLAARGVARERILVDAIALPWGDDFAAGRGMLEFVAEWSRRASSAGALVGLGNLGHGRPDAVRINREWWALLRDAGIAAALVDAFEPGLLSGTG